MCTCGHEYATHLRGRVTQDSGNILIVQCFGGQSEWWPVRVVTSQSGDQSEWCSVRVVASQSGV